MKKEKIGFIVVNGDAKWLGKTGDEKGILWYGDAVTIFKTKKAAKAAIERTIKFQKKNKYNWDTEDCLIMELER